VPRLTSWSAHRHHVDVECISGLNRVWEIAHPDRGCHSTRHTLAPGRAESAVAVVTAVVTGEYDKDDPSRRCRVPAPAPTPGCSRRSRRRLRSLPPAGFRNRNVGSRPRRVRSAFDPLAPKPGPPPSLGCASFTTEDHGNSHGRLLEGEEHTHQVLAVFRGCFRGLPCFRGEAGRATDSHRTSPAERTRCRAAPARPAPDPPSPRRSRCRTCSRGRRSRPRSRSPDERGAGPG